LLKGFPQTDLPSGIVGDMVNWSQDHITQHLLHLHSVAPTRVQVFGLCRQDDYRARIKVACVVNIFFVQLISYCDCSNICCATVLAVVMWCCNCLAV
jgi:hypothetical protein